MLRSVGRQLALGLLLVGAAGCGSSPPGAKDKPGAPPPARQAAAKPAPAEGAQTNPPEVKPAAEPQPPVDTQPPRAPGNAAEAVLAVLAGIRENHPEALWDFLPGSMQTQLNDLVRQFGQSIDATIWQRTVAVLRKVVQVLKSKREFVQESSHWKNLGAIDLAELESRWDDIVALCEAVLDSELADVDQLRTFNGRDFLAGSGAKVLARLKALADSDEESPYRQLERVKVTLKSETAQTAVVTIELPGQPPGDHEFALLEGKWCPKSWSGGAPQLAALQKAVAGALQPEALQARKGQILHELELVEQLADELIASQTLEEFDDLIARRVIPHFAARMPAFGPEKKSAVPAEHANDSVTVIVRGSLGPARGQELMTELASRSDDARLSVVSGPNGTEGEWSFTLMPVIDVEAFAARCTFSRVVHVDAEGRTVTLELRAADR